MGKSGAKRKKSANGNAPSSTQSPIINATINAITNTTTRTSSSANGVHLDSTIFLKQAHEVKEEGNRLFQSKDYFGAFHHYEQALKLIPTNHPDRAVFHSNRATCLLQMKPVHFDAVVSECTLALAAQPHFPRALLRRARAFEALGDLDSAVKDVAILLNSDPHNQDALEIASELRIAVGATNDHGNPPPSLHPSAVSVPSSYLLNSSSSSSSSSYSGTSPAALGASAVLGAPVAGIGPCLTSHGVPKKPATKVSEKPGLREYPISPASNHNNGISGSGKVAHTSSSLTASIRPEKTNSELPPIVLRLFKESGSPLKPVSVCTEPLSSASISEKPTKNSQVVPLPVKWRPLKLVRDHDIRMAQMPVDCSFKVLREIVKKRFPSSKSVLIKYKDLEGDLVTITGTKELRFAEACCDRFISASKRLHIGNDGGFDGSYNLQLQSLRLHIVDVSPEQEPPLIEEEEEEEEAVEKIPFNGGAKVESIKSEQTTFHASVCETVSEDKELAKHVDSENGVPKEKNFDDNQNECKEIEIDDWLFEFVELFRSYVGIDPDGHVDLHDLGMELCSEALEERVTSEDAQTLFEMAALQFQEVAALGFFNWGNVHTCAARKRIPLDESLPKEVILAQIHGANDWVKERYSLAGQKYEEALRIKPDFYEGLLALGQQHFEIAKLHWTYALANKVNLTAWDSGETMKLFDSAEEKMNAATEMWEKLEEQKNSDVKDPITLKKEEILSRRKASMGVKEGLAAVAGGHGVDLGGDLDEAVEQAAAMRSQIHLFWGNMLFERSQVEFNLGMPHWRKNLEDSIKRFKLAGASEADIEAVLKKHSSSDASLEEDGEKTAYSSVEVSTSIKGENRDTTIHR